MKQNASKEGKLIVKEAEKTADRIVNEALAKSRRIALEIDELKKQAKVYRTRFRMLVEAQLDMLNDEDWEGLEQSMDEEHFPQEVDESLEKAE